MTHEDCLNHILAHACGRRTDEELSVSQGVQEYYIELHCHSYLVEAKPLGNLKYEILGMKVSE